MVDKNYLVKVASLGLLILQNVILVLLLRYVRTRNGDMFSSSTAVVFSEIMKLATCFLILLFQFNFDISKFICHIRENILKDVYDWLLIAVPAVLYVGQNNLLFIAVSNLDTASFQVCYQLKLLTTAVFFRLLMKRPLSRVQWLSLLLLFVGIVMVQLQQVREERSLVVQSRLTGFVAVVVASMMSGYSGVFFEKILKGTEKDLWVRNIQLSMYGVVFGAMTVCAYEGRSVASRGVFAGYDGLVWLVIAVQALGGLLVAVVVKYADNILKGFATSAAIVLAAVIAVPLFNFHVTLTFVLAAGLVIFSSTVYPCFPPQSSLTADDDDPSLRPQTK